MGWTNCRTRQDTHTRCTSIRYGQIRLGLALSDLVQPDRLLKSGEKFTPCKLIYRLVNPGKPNQPLTHAVNRIIAYLLYNKHVEVDRLGQDDKRKIIIYLSPRIKEGGYPCYVFCYQYYPEKERRKKC